MNQRGYMIAELMMSVALLAVLCAAMTGMVQNTYRSSHTASAYVSDLEHLRRALRRLEADVRAAVSVASSATSSGRANVVTVRHPTATMTYRLQSGVLSRSANNQTRVIARRIGSLTATTKGRLVDVQLTIEPRQKTAPPALVHTRVQLRIGGAP